MGLGQVESIVMMLQICLDKPDHVSLIPFMSETQDRILQARATSTFKARILHNLGTYTFPRFRLIDAYLCMYGCWPLLGLCRP